MYNFHSILKHIYPSEKLSTSSEVPQNHDDLPSRYKDPGLRGCLFGNFCVVHKIFIYLFNKILNIFYIGPVEEAPEHQIQQLTTQLEEAEIRNEKLKDENQKLKTEKYSAELSKAKLEKELEEREKEIEELKSKLDDAHKEYLKYKEKERKLCTKDCVVWSLLWICCDRLNERLCGRQIEKMITTHAERKHRISNEHLCCEYFMPMLEKCDIASQKFTMTFHNEYCDKETDEVWQTLLRVDAKDLVLMVLIKYLGTDGLGHCMVYDLEKRNEGLLEYHDLQNGVRGELRGEQDLKKYVKTAKDITLYTVDTEHLRKIINCHKDSPSEFGCDCERKMLLAPPVDTEQVASPAPDALDETLSTCD